MIANHYLKKGSAFVKFGQNVFIYIK